MTWLKRVFGNQSNEAMEQEQLLYQLREAQNATVEIGNMLSQVASGQSGQIDTQQIQHLEQLNSRVGGFLQRLRQRIDREMK